MKRFQEFFKNVTMYKSVLQGRNTKSVKELLGDSVNNNRTLTVNQLIRFLTLAKDTTFANQISAVNEIIEPLVMEHRFITGSKRTDAIDYNEFVSVYRTEVMNNRNHRKVIGRALSKV